MFTNLKELKDRIIVADIVGHFIKLKKSGSTLSACCPFHNEKSASFTIHAKQNAFKCFGCGKGARRRE
jgi:DNA primase